jgi:hypothetical protein
MQETGKKKNRFKVSKRSIQPSDRIEGPNMLDLAEVLLLLSIANWRIGALVAAVVGGSYDDVVTKDVTKLLERLSLGLDKEEVGDDSISEAGWKEGHEMSGTKSGRRRIEAKWKNVNRLSGYKDREVLPR